MDRHLLVFFGLLALAGVAISLPGSEPAVSHELWLERLPLHIDGWTARTGAPETILPTDPRAVETVRRTYSNDGRTVWLSVAAYRSRNHPERRPSLNHIAPEAGATTVMYDRRRIDLPGSPQAAIGRISVERKARRVSILYWYQLGERPIVDEYQLRFRLFVNTLLGHQPPLVLVRLATEGTEAPPAFVRALPPHLVTILSR